MVGTGYEELVAKQHVAPHVDELHMNHRWPPHVAGRLNTAAHPTLSMTLSLQLPSLDPQGLRHYPIHWDKEQQRLLGEGGAEDLGPGMEGVLRTFEMNYANYLKLRDAGRWAVHKYTVGSLSLHSGDEYHAQEYPHKFALGDMRITLQMHGMWVDDAWQIFW